MMKVQKNGFLFQPLWKMDIWLQKQIIFHIGRF